MKIAVDTQSLADLMAKIANASDTWPEEKRGRFVSEWRRLVDDGCEWVTLNGMIATPSEDMIAHARAYGVPV